MPSVSKSLLARASRPYCGTPRKIRRSHSQEFTDAGSRVVNEAGVKAE
jgi:hypothetical protein